MARTTTFQAVRNKWAALSGLDRDNLIDVDANAFTEYFNRNYRIAWQRGLFPFSVKIKTLTTNASGFADLSADTDIEDLLQVYDSNPRTDDKTKLLSFILGDDGVYVPQAVSDTVYAEYREREPVFDGSLGQTLPFQFQDYLAQACYADWLMAEGQNGKARIERQHAEALLDLEIDRYERQQQQQPRTNIQTRITGFR